MDSLADHLRTLTQQQLTTLVTERRDLTIDPAPKTVDHLVLRLLHPPSMAAACSLLTRPQLQVAEAAAALGDGFTTARLATLLGVPENDADLASALRRLIELALTWPDGDGFAAAQLSAMWPDPLDLGPSAAELFASRNMTELRRLAKRYGIPGSGVKEELIDALVGWLAEPENVRRLVAGAPADVRARLGTLALRPASPFGVRGIMFGPPGVTLPWAADFGLVVRSGWGVEEMPREVALALRDGYVAPFDRHPPVTPTNPVDPQTAEREASAAASGTLAAITAIGEALGSAPVSLLKTGGLGVREVRRLAKLSGQDEDTVRLTLELLAAGGFTDVSDAGLTLSVAYDEFAAAEPATQLVDVVQTWLAMPGCPLAPADSTASSSRLLYWAEDEEVTLTGLRGLALRTLVAVVPEGHATELGPLTDRMAWQSPVLTDQAGEELERYVTGIWREAHRLGLLAHGAVTGLCRGLLTGGVAAARRQAAAMLPRSRDSVVLQNDLTAVVTGTPSVNLLALLDSAAAPESRSGAWTWRFSPATIRAALDAGSTATDLTARLAEVAEDGRVPQTLAYLIDDVARQHGRVRVIPSGCCLCSDDVTLLTEILNTRALRPLHLVRLAPTVLASAKPQEQTLAALRAAGYAPAALRADGSPAIEIPQRRRVVPPPDGPDADDLLPPRLSDPAEVARTLFGNR